MESPPVDVVAQRSNGSTIKLIRDACAFLLAGFSLYTAFFGIMSDMIQRSVHLGLVLVLVYLGALVPSSLNLSSSRFLKVLSIVLAVIGALTMFYHVWFFDEIASRYGELTPCLLYTSPSPRDS